MTELNGRVVLDPLYGYIELNPNLANLADHVFVQRLRRISQTSLASYVYPALTGSRFEHALGASFLAREGFRSAIENSSTRVVDDLLDEIRAATVIHGDALSVVEDAVSAAALLHDLGHPPFSHALDRLAGSIVFQHHVGREAIEELEEEGFPACELHEAAGGILSEAVLERVPDDVRRISKAILSHGSSRGSWSDCLHDLIAAEIDVDRLDYLIRDNTKAGTEYGAIDFRRVLESLEIRRNGSQFEIGFGFRARSAVEHLLVQRYQSYRWVYLHPRVVAFDLCVERSIELLIELSRSESSLEHFPEEASIGRLFSQALPKIDFWRVDETVDLRFQRELIDSETGEFVQAEQLAFEDEELALLSLDSLDAFRLEKQAAFDDAAVLSSLQSALQTARLTWQFVADRALRARVERFIYYASAALYRDKSAVAVWKHYEEFAEVADQLRGRGTFVRLLERAADVLGETANQQSVELISGLAEEATDAEPVKTLNDILARVCGRDPSGLAGGLTLRSPNPSAGVYGFWDGVYRGYRTVESSGGTRLLYGSGRTVELRETSPLLRALDEARDHSIRFFLYFFVTTRSGTAIVESSHIRRDLQSRFVSEFEDLIQDPLIEYFREYDEI